MEITIDTKDLILIAVLVGSFVAIGSEITQFVITLVVYSVKRIFFSGKAEREGEE